MDIKILAVGKIKENYLKLAIAEYEKRLRTYVNLDIIELSDEKAPEKLSKAQLQSVLQKEGEKILSKIPKDSYIISLCIEGKQFSSESFAEKIKSFENEGVKNLVLIIGGSNGLWQEVISSSNELLSFSKFTFPHQLMRVILLEQIYRAYRINNNHPYHK